MVRSKEHLAKYLRTLLTLGRVSNLPTVWSNCMAGWWAAGGKEMDRLFLLILGSTFLYLGGMFLNDAFDADFDRQHKSDRPIPAGMINLASVWQWGFSWLVLGLLSFGLLGSTPLFWAVLLTGSILLYDAIHKMIAFAPVIMAWCRFLLILTAASMTKAGVNGYSIWVALALGGYVVGLSFLARREGRPQAIDYWPCLFLAAPLVLALVVNRGPEQLRGVMLCAILLVWTLLSLRHIFWSYQPNTARGVSGLLAGIVLVDLLAAGGGSFWLILFFLLLFLMALVFQRFIPAT